MKVIDLVVEHPVCMHYNGCGYLGLGLSRRLVSIIICLGVYLRVSVRFMDSSAVSKK